MKSYIKKFKGSVALKTFVFIPLVILLLVIFLFVFYEARKAYWDYQVDKMCGINGGIKIDDIFKADLETYESLKNKFGQIDIPKKGSNRSIGAALVHTYEDNFINDGYPKVRRSVISVIRIVDNTVIATSTVYSRVGGDLITLHPSYYSCPKSNKDFFSSVVVKMDTK